MSEHDREKARQDLRESATAVAELCERIAYGAIAFGITYVGLRIVFRLPPHAIAEPAALNAGVAYYTHAATGRVIRALYVIVRTAPNPSRRERREVAEDGQKGQDAV